MQLNFQVEIMNLNALTAISPVDGRYRRAGKELATYFSEYALIRYRVRVEIEYFIALCEIPLPQLENIDKSLYTSLRAIYKDFTEDDAQAIKDIEKVTEFPNASRDAKGRLLCGAAIGPGADLEERANALMNAGVDVLVLDR